MKTREERCDLTELLVDQCACRLHAKKTEEPKHNTWRSGSWFIARYPGECSSCEESFEAGNEIRADGSGGYICYEFCSDVSVDDLASTWAPVKEA